MKVYLSNERNDLRGQLANASSLTIGNFDGCHIGHQELLRLAKKAALQTKAETTVLTFDPHPREFFSPGTPLPRLFQAKQKLRALKELGITQLVIQKFNKELSQEKPEEFCDFLKNILKTEAIAIGHDFRFGQGRKGSIDDLRMALPKAIIQEATAIQLGEEIASSSAIRTHLEESRVKEANALLGRPYLIEGTIQKGKQLGRQLGFPTANISVSSQMLPKPGVYCGYAALKEESPIFALPFDKVPCILNVGYRPTIAQDRPELLVEVHLLEGHYGADSLYELPLAVYLVDFIRGEQKFQGLDELKTQIKIDCELAKQKT